MSKTKAGVILTNDDTTKVLVIINKSCIDSGITKYGLPKGHRERGEAIEACAMRELREETGLMVRISGRDPRIVTSKTTYFLIKASRMVEPNPQDTTEVGACLWVPWEEIMTHDCNYGLKLIKEKLRKHNSQLFRRLRELKPRAIGFVSKKPCKKQEKPVSDETDVGTDESSSDERCTTVSGSDSSSVDVP